MKLTSKKNLEITVMNCLHFGGVKVLKHRFNNMQPFFMYYEGVWQIEIYEDSGTEDLIWHKEFSTCLKMLKYFEKHFS